MISKAQWEQISHFMKGLYNTIEFELDGRNIKVTKAFVSENKVAYVVYIDNQLAPGMGFQNMKNFDPFTEKVWRRRSKAVYSVARVKEIEKAFGKRDAKNTFQIYTSQRFGLIRVLPQHQASLVSLRKTRTWF